MAEYKERPVNGTTYVRCAGYEFHDPKFGRKMLRFRETEVFVVPGRDDVKPLGIVTRLLENGAMSEEFPILDLQTNEPTGQTMSYRSLYRALKSAYWHTAAARDAGTLPVDE